MKISFNPSNSNKNILDLIKNNKDIIFDLKGHSIFARGVEFKGTDTNTWRDIKINNVSIGSHTLDLRNGSNTTLTNTNGVVTINSTWRPVVDNLTSDSTTSSLSAKQGKVLKALIDGKSNSDHNHDDRYLKLTGGTMAGNALITFADSGSWSTDKGPQGARGGLYWTGQSDYAKLYAEETAGDNLDLVIQFGDNNSNGLSIRNKANTQTSYISAGGVITTGTFKGNLDWSYITNKPSSYTPSAHTHAWNSLTHSSTTENQAILTNGKANGWKLQTLNIARWDNAANNAHSHANKSVLDGITSALVNSWNTAYNFVSNITGTDTDKVINKWEEIVNFLAGITEDNKLNTLLNSKLSIQQLSAKDILTTKTNNALFWVDTKGNASTITTGPFTDHPYALLSVTNYNQNAENYKFFYRSRLAFSSAGDIKVASCHHENEYQQDETWYNVLTSKNSGINGSTIKLNGTSITVYSSGTADGRYVKKSGDTMSGVLTIDTTNFGALTIKRNDDANGASIQFRGKSSVYGYIGLNNSTKDKQFLRWSSDTSRIYTILDTSSTYISNGKGVINGTTITQVDNATNSTNSTNARKLINWYSARPTSLNAQFGDGSLRIFYATSSTTEGKPAEDSHILHLAWDNTGGWDAQLAVHARSGKVSTRAQNGGTWQPWKTLAFITDIPTSLKNPYALTISLNGTSQGPYDGSAAKNINITPGSIGAAVSNHSHDYLVVNSADDKSFNSAYHNFQVLYAGGDNRITGKPANVDAFGLFKFRAASGWSGQMLLANGGSLYIRSSEDAKMTNTLAWKTILDSSNYSGILDSRYYTESEVNSLLSRKLDRVNLTTGSWNPRGWNLAADYHYNGGDLSISESGGKIHVSVDGYFWQNEGQYRVLDTSDVAGLKSNLTVHQQLSATDATWYPLVWGGNSHNNTSDSTGAVYKSYDKLSWQTSSQTLYATNIQTNNIKNLSIGGGIYWNPNVESASDGSDAASITLVRSGVAGGTTLVLSQMNDTNDTIQFKTNTAARLYHNSYPILTTQNTYVSNNKGYINGTEITQVNNSDKVDNRHAISTTPNTGIIYKAAIYTSYSLTSYWVRLASIPSINQNGEFVATIHVQSGHANLGRSAILLVYLRGNTSSFMAKSFKICCNSNYDPNRFRLYYKDSNKTSEIWYQTTGQWDGIITTVISQSSEGSLYEGLTLYSGSITAVQTPSVSTYLSAQVSTIKDNISGNASTATKLQTPRTIWGQSFDGTADVNGTIYINNSNSSNGAIRLNNNINSNARISAIDDQVIFNTGNSIRFGETSWDQNQWAGLKYTHYNKTIYLGIADNSIFTANSTQSGGTLSLTNINTLQFGVPEAHIGYNGSYSDPWGGLSANFKFGGVLAATHIYSNGGFHKNGSSDSYVLLGGGGHKAISDFAISTHTHGLLHSNLTVTLANTTTDSGWSMINSSYNGFLLKSIRTQGSAPNWIENNYAAGICFGGSNTKGVVSVAYDRPYIKFAGGNGSKPIWWIRLSGISGATYNLANFNADTLDGEHASSFVRAGYYENNDLNKLDTYSFIRSVNSNVSSTSPKGNTGWYNVIQLVHRNGASDGPSYIGQIALGMTTNTNDMFFRGKRTDPWKTVIHSGNYTEFINNYYWANVKISTSSSTTTSPTVHTLTATRVCAGHNPGIDNSISCSNWFRSSGNTGWYNTTYQGGWYMSDTSWIRAHNGVGIYTSGQIYSSSSIRMSNILLEHTDEINNSANGDIHLNYRNSGNVSLCYGGGNVGIGTTSPTQKLDVVGNIRATGQLYLPTNGNYNAILMGDDCWMGDCNINNVIGLSGTNNANSGGIKFGKGGMYIGYNGSNHYSSGTSLWYNFNADTVDGEHASNFSYTHQTSFDFSKSKSGRIVTFDQSNTDYGWINGFASTYNNYLTSVIFNTHRTSNWYVGYMEGRSTGETNGLQAVHRLAFADGDESYPIFLGYLNLYNGNDGTISNSFSCLGYSVPFTYTRGGAYCRINIPNTSFQTFYIKAAIASVHYSGAGMDSWVGNHRGEGAWWLHCDAVGSNAVQVKGFHLANEHNDSWWGGNPLYSGDGAAKIITVCLFGYVKYK